MLENKIYKIHHTGIVVKDGFTTLEFIEPLNEQSTVYNFLQKTNGGIHHLCYEVPSIEEGIEHFKNFGRLISQPVLGLCNRQVAFFYLKKAHMGMRIIEIVEV